MIEYQAVDDSGQKSRICDAILHALPNWFGVEASIADYTTQVRAMPFWAAFDGEVPVGFVALKAHNPTPASCA